MPSNKQLSETTNTDTTNNYKSNKLYYFFKMESLPVKIVQN